MKENMFEDHTEIVEMMKDTIQVGNISLSLPQVPRENLDKYFDELVDGMPNEIFFGNAKEIEAYLTEELFKDLESGEIDYIDFKRRG